MPLCLPDDRGGTETYTVKRLDLERPSVSAIEGIFTVLITGVHTLYSWHFYTISASSSARLLEG